MHREGEIHYTDQKGANKFNVISPSTMGRAVQSQLKTLNYTPIDHFIPELFLMAAETVEILISTPDPPPGDVYGAPRI